MIKVNQTQRYRKRIAMYALIGPLIGLLLIDTVIIALWFFEILTIETPMNGWLSYMGDSLRAFLAINFLGLAFAYIIGLIPAIITGIFAARFRTYKSEAICATLIGATPFIIIYMTTSIIENKAINSEYLSLITLAVIGAISGLVCAGLRRPEKAAHTG